MISPNQILTAAHCVSKRKNRELLAVIGTHDRNEPFSFKNTFKIIQITVHEGYNELTKKNDIAILRLQYPLTMTKYISTVCLPTFELYENIFNKTTVLVGW